MNKGLLCLIALVGLSLPLNAQQAPSTATPAAHPTAPATKEVPATGDSLVAILKAQRAVQSAQISATERRQKAVETEQKLEQQEEGNLKQTLSELNTAVDKARADLKLPATTPFDQGNLSFTVPAAK